MKDLPMRVLFTEEQIQTAVKDVAARIRDRWGAEQDVLVITLLNGALWFAADLLRALPSSYILHSLRVSSYGSSHQSSGKLTWHGALPVTELQGKKVLVLDDVIDSGLTLSEVKAELMAQGASDVLCAVAIEKKPLHARSMEADFVALKAGHEFLIGYGMDENGRYRNLPYIAELLPADALQD